MNTTLGRNHGVQLIDDHVFDFTDDGLEAWGSNGNGQAFWSGDQNMGWLTQHFLSVRLRGITGTQANTNLLSTVRKVVFGDFIQWTDEVSLDIVGQGLNR